MAAVAAVVVVLDDGSSVDDGTFAAYHSVVAPAKADNLFRSAADTRDSTVGPCQAVAVVVVGAVIAAAVAAGDT